jgi:hypothetical protein
VKALKSNIRTKIDFGKANEAAEVKLPPSLSDDDLFSYNLSMLDRFDPDEKIFSTKEEAKIMFVLIN